MNKTKPISEQKEVNIIGNNNGVGLTQDVEILRTELTQLGYNVRYKDGFSPDPVEKAYINIFIEDFKREDLKLADINLYIPNPEWCYATPLDMVQFDAILCKTKEVERIFSEFCPERAIYMGFTCKDRFQQSIKKDYHSCFHLTGKSLQKGTQQVVKAWLNNPQWPHLFLVKYSPSAYPPAENIAYMYGFLPLERLVFLQNHCGVHLCPSETEGFGHYIMEAFSCGAVVVTTDAPPMNEFVTDPRCLVGYDRTAPQWLATNYFVDSKKMEGVLSNLFALSEDELVEIGKRNREFYLENDRKFKERFAEIFTRGFDHIRKIDPLEFAFTDIHRKRVKEGLPPSGEGSIPENTGLYCAFVQKFLQDQNIHSVVEIGPGDWSCSKLIDWTGIDYKGYDVCKELVDLNQGQFGCGSIEFIHGNGCRLDLPEADLLLCKDVLQHLPNHEIERLVQQIGKFKHVLFVNDVHPETLTADNLDIPIGSYRPLDLTKPPFNLKGQKVFTYACGRVTKQVFYLSN